MDPLRGAALVPRDIALGQFQKSSGKEKKSDERDSDSHLLLLREPPGRPVRPRGRGRYNNAARDREDPIQAIFRGAADCWNATFFCCQSYSPINEVPPTKDKERPRLSHVLSSLSAGESSLEATAQKYKGMVKVLNSLVDEGEGPVSKMQRKVSVLSQRFSRYQLVCKSLVDTIGIHLRKDPMKRGMDGKLDVEAMANSIYDSNKKISDKVDLIWKNASDLKKVISEGREIHIKRQLVLDLEKEVDKLDVVQKTARLYAQQVARKWGMQKIVTAASKRAPAVKVAAPPVSDIDDDNSEGWESVVPLKSVEEGGWEKLF